MNESEQPNLSMEQKCPQCGAPLPSGVLAGLCPACLMKQGAAADTGAGPDAPPFQPPGVAEMAQMFPQLEIIALIGKGGMGAVYKARQPGLDRMVALKILPPQTANGPGFVERFNREARALARLNHPNIVAVYEFGTANGLPYFIMEFVDGLNLRELERAGKLSAREALQIVPQICEALQFAHDEGIVHRDIKPENILLDKKGRVKIADFGIAKILSGAPEADLTSTKGAIGTPHYMAPEQMEKPTTVDHRADIFSLGVVFYEMLTGELPLGKFAPPSSRKIEVDVRLDDVVLRALEKDPELRYQHASQVKTAVDTIAGSAAPPPPSPAADAAAMAKEILTRDYALNIGSCVRRGWKLLKREFWPFVGITLLFIALLGFASTFGGASVKHQSGGEDQVEFASAVAMLVWGPLMGGLLFYFLKKIRLQAATVETAFSGFTRQSFLQLFLAGFVTSLLTWLGFLCLVLPGIYLLVAWMFTLPLVVDKRLDFWSAMELSRKVVTKHWFKVFGFGIVLFLLYLAGMLALIVGVFVASPLILAAMMYAYEDIFGGVVQPSAAPAGIGPTGTVVMPPVAAQPARAAGGNWTLPTTIGLAGIGLLAICWLGWQVLAHHRHSNYSEPSSDAEAQVVQDASGANSQAGGMAQVVVPDQAPAPLDKLQYGPVSEGELTNLAVIKLASGNQDALPSSVTEQNRGPEKDAAACAWMESMDKDFAYIGAYDGFYGMTRNMVTLKRGDWDDTSPESLAGLLHDTGHDVGERFGDSSPMNNPTNYTYGFKTRDGSVGLLQVVSFTETPPGVKIRYKLVQAAANPNAVAVSGASKEIHELLTERLEAASNISDYNEKDQPLVALAIDAAKAGEAEIAKKAVDQIYIQDTRDTAMHDTAMLLAKHGMRKQAIEIAKSITGYSTRNQTLAELAQ
jgi:predicted Ser/Thr protein kinase